MELSTDSHIKYIQKKINFIKYKLTPIRSLQNTKLNVNIFKLMCGPLFRLGICNATILKKSR
jgi:hypothetical protein